MTKARIILGSPESSDAPWLRSAEISDQNTLRAWRNKNRKAFFDDSIIDEARQRNWFKNYQERSDDYLFIVQARSVAIGVIGMQLRPDGWGLYNVIRGRRSAQTQTFMAQGLVRAVVFIQACHDRPILAEVIENNPSLNWYLDMGFTIISRGNRAYNLKLQMPLQLQVEA